MSVLSITPANPPENDITHPTTLIEAQDAHIRRILDATPYSDRNDMGDLTLLRRKVRTLRASRGKYYNDLARLGFTQEQARITMQDAEDMAVLEHNSIADDA